MWYEDLTECDYFGNKISGALTAVGWLEKEKSFATGMVPLNFYKKLCEISKNPWSFSLFPGFHDCDLCQFEGQLGNKNVFVPYNNKIYVCPELITHYINGHYYLPPNEFVEAVINCPPQGSMEYLKKILENGGRQLVKALKNNESNNRTNQHDERRS